MPGVVSAEGTARQGHSAAGQEYNQTGFEFIDQELASKALGLGHIPFVADGGSAAENQGRDSSLRRRRWLGGRSLRALCQAGSGLQAHDLLQQRRGSTGLRTAEHFGDIATDLQWRYAQAPRKTPPTEQSRKEYRPKLAPGST